MQFFMSLFLGLLLSVSVGAKSLLEGRVRLSSGQPAAGVQVRLFDLADLRRSISTTTDETGHFTLTLQAFAPGSALPQGFALGQNYPNPFNPSTLIPYQIPTAARVRLEVFNLLGQRVATLVDGEQSAGAHTAQWDATDATGRAVGAGVYIYRLSSGGATVSRRMVLIDGQAGIPAAGAAGPMPMPASALERVDAAAGVYGLTVVGDGLVAYVNPAFRVGVDAADIVVEAHTSQPRMKRMAGGILGDVDNDGQVDAFDALYVALYSENPSITLPNNGDISLGDINGDGAVNLADALLLAAYSVNPLDPSLPAGVGAIPLPLGESLAGGLEIGGEVDYFRVEVSEPGLLLVYTTGSSRTKGTLEDSTGTALATDDDGGRSDNFRITHFVNAGTYYVKVEGDYSSSTGSYTIYASIHGTTRDQAPSLTLGESLEGELEIGGEVDYFRVEVSEPGLLLVYTTGSSRTKGTLEDSTGGSLATNDDGGRSDNFRITHFVNAGTYYVKVEGDYSSSTGSYTIYASIHGTTRDQAASLPLNSSLAGGLEIGGEVDYFRVEVSEPGLLLVYTTGSSRTKGTLEDSTGGSLATDDDGGRSDNFKIAHTPVSAGTYYVKVEGDYSSSTGSYTIHTSFIISDHGSTRDQATSLPLGESLAGGLEPAGDVDYFRVEVSEPGLLLVYTTGSSRTKGTLEDSTGGSLATNDDGGRSDNFRIAHFVNAGTYYVKVEGDYSSSTGSYTIYASIHGTTRDQAASLPLNSSLAGGLEIGGEVDYFRVEVSEPGLLLVYTTGSSRTKGTLEDSTGGSLATNDDGGRSDNFRIAHFVNAGTYYVKVEGDYSSSTGSYTIYASIHGTTRDQAASLPLNSSLAGGLEIGGEVDYFRVEVSEPGLLLVYTTGSSRTKGTLEDSTGGSLATDDDGGRSDNFKIAHTPVSAGTYYVKVEGDYSSSTGSYTIYASFISDHGNTRATASLLSLDSLLYGQIEPAGDVDYFQIEVSESEVLTVYTTGSLDTKGTLEDSTGTALATDDDGGSGDNFRIAHSVSAGTYYVKVEGDSSSSSGTGIYTIHASVSSSGDGDGGGGPCTVGLEMNPGEGCSGFGYTLHNDSGMLVVNGSIGGITMSNTRLDSGSVSLNNLRLTRSGNVWTIVSLP